MTPAEPTDAAVDELVILASPRSGTNYFCEALTAFHEINGFYELFNPAGAFGVGPKILRHLNPHLGLNAEKPTDPDLRKAFRGQPLVALDALGKVARDRGASMISYKIFPGQLPPATLEALIASEHRHPLFIVRSRLDVYVSLVKARTVNAYTNKNTADVKPEIDIQGFLHWAEKTDDFYEFCLRAARDHGKKFVVFRYESDIDLPRIELLQTIQRGLARLDLKVEVPETVKPERYKRQDQRVSPFEKIANGEELLEALRAAGRYEYALAAPLEDEASDLSDRPPVVDSGSRRRPWRRLFRAR